MKLTVIGFLALAGLFAAAPARACHVDPTAAWTAAGFVNPESAYFDPETQTIYVSNVAGDPTAKDGNGFISALSPDGKIKQLHWLDGFNAPKGIRVQAGFLYVTDIDRVVVVDVAKKKIARTVSIPKAKFLNDLAIDKKDNLYVTDTTGNAVYSISSKGKVRKLLAGPETEGPNGILVDGEKLFIAAWGKNVKPDLSSDTPGRLLEVDLKTKKIRAITPNPTGNLDGLERDNHGDWIVSDWVAGKILHVAADGGTRDLIVLKQGTADIGFVPKESLVIVPQMKENTVTAYKLR